MEDHPILIGCDPELFVFTTSGRPLSAHDLLPGNKWDPHFVDKGAVQVDGVAAEFNITPAKTADEFVENIFSVRNEMLRIIRTKRLDVELRATPTIKFTKRQWMAIPEEAKMIGCEPDFSAYTLGANIKPETDKFMRTGGGHVHISWGQPQESVRIPWPTYVAGLVRHLDTHLFPESLKWDADQERREMYGCEGAFRPKDYGVEYRPLSNKWLESEKTIRYVYNTVKKCTTMWLNNYQPGYYTVEKYA